MLHTVTQSGPGPGPSPGLGPGLTVCLNSLKSTLIYEEQVDRPVWSSLALSQTFCVCEVSEAVSD